jgi:hypothetical protein
LSEVFSFLILSMTAIPANGLPVPVKSEAFSSGGPCRKVLCAVFAVLNGSSGSAWIVQGRVPIVRKIIQLASFAFSLILFASHSQAHLGWTLTQFKQQYGQPILAQAQIAGRTGYVFTGEDCLIAAFFRDTQVSRVLYIRRGGSVFDWGTARALLIANAPDAVWDDASRNEADKSYRVNGLKDGVESYYASLTDDGQMLAIWTKEDDQAGRTKADTPSVSSVIASNEKSTGQVTAAPGRSSGTESGSEKNDPAAATAAAASPEDPAPTPASPTKIVPTAPVKRRSSASHREASHVEHLETKVRRLSHRSGLGQPEVRTPVPTATPLLMNSGTGLYNSDNTQPFKNSKGTPEP